MECELLLVSKAQRILLDRDLQFHFLGMDLMAIGRAERKNGHLVTMRNSCLQESEPGEKDIF